MHIPTGKEMVLNRLWNGGFDRLEKYGDISENRHIK